MKYSIQEIVQQSTIPTQHAWWLLEFVTGKSSAQLQYSQHVITDQEYAVFNQYIKEIKDEHKPLAYILGWVPFLNLNLEIAPPTLIPRPETEYWVDQVIAMLNTYEKKDWNIVDIGTGSGCIALSIAQAFPQAKIYALDIAESAINLAKKNAANNNIHNVTFLQSDLFSAVAPQMKFDLIVTNPPYIDPATILEKSVTDWEDHRALFARNHGLAIIERIANEAQQYLYGNELEFQLIIEVDTCQVYTVQELLTKNNFKKCSIKQDQFDRNRTVWAK